MFFPSSKRTSSGVFFFVFLLAAIGITFTLAQKSTDNRQRAAAKNMYYVSKNGNNADGKTYTTAWNELNQIKWAVIQPGDIIILDGGANGMTYTTTLTIGRSGSQGLPVTIEKSVDPGHAGQVHLFGGRSILLPYCGQSNYTYQTAGVNQHGIDFAGNSWISIDGMQWHGITLYGNNNDGIVLENSTTNDTIRNMEIYDNGDASHGSGGWSPNQKGIALQGSNHLFEQVDVHDNGQDNFQSAGNNTVTINRSWLHVSREDPNNPGLPYNECQHQDGIQIYSGGTQTGLTITNSIDGPGMKEGVILGQSPQSNGNSAIVNHVTFRNDLFLNKVNNIFGYPAVKENGWVIDHVTIWDLNVQTQGAYPSSLFLEGSGHSVTNSILYQGPVYLPDGLASSANNCQWKTTGSTSVVKGKTVDPQFVTDISGFGLNTPLATIANADFSLKSSSPCQGAGSSVTSVAQFLRMVGNSPTPTSVSPSPTPPLSSPTPVSLTPTPTLTPGTTNLSLIVGLHGIGNGGDNANPHSTGTSNPLHPSRSITVTFSDTSNIQKGFYSGTVTFDPASGLFKGTLPLGNLSTGNYQVMLHVPEFLASTLQTIIHINANQSNTTPTVYLVTGDIDEKNQLDILDYNILISCFGDKQKTSSCIKPTDVQPLGITGADIDDSGHVDGADYNLFIRELSVQHGQ